MPSLKDIRKRIGTVKNTQKITKAMKMVAAAKLRRAQEAVTSTRPYAEKLMDVIDHLTERVDIDQHPLLRNPEVPQSAVVLSVTADRGLCGAYNSNVLRRTEALLESRTERYEDVDLVLLGRKAREYFKHRDWEVTDQVEDPWGREAFDVGKELAEDWGEKFSNGEVDEVFVVYTRFRSAIAQEVVVDRVLPLRNVKEHDDVAEFKSQVEYIYEPSAHELLTSLLPRAVAVQFQRALMESVASEHGARMTAMDNATNNATEMIDKLTLQYNRARQAAITTELTEIISGAEAV